MRRREAKRPAGAPAIEAATITGPLLMLTGIGLFGLLDANSKLLAEDHGVWQVLLVRFVTMVAGVLVIRALVPGWGGALTTQFPRLHALRAVVSLGSAVFFFLAFSTLPLAQGYLVFFTSPFIVLVLAATVLREPPPRIAWVWCVVGFAGVAIGLAPRFAAGGASASLIGYGYALCGTVCYSAVFILNRQLRAEPGIARVMLWPALLGLVVSLPLGIAEWTPVSTLGLVQMIVNGVIVAAAVVALAEAFRHASAARLAPFGYSGLVWSLTFDLAIWGAVPAWATLAGAGVVIFACVMSERASQGTSSGK